MKHAAPAIANELAMRSAVCGLTRPAKRFADRPPAATPAISSR